MRDLGAQLRTYIDAVAPPVTAAEVAKGRERRPRRLAVMVAVAAVVVGAIVTIGIVSMRNDSEPAVQATPATHAPRPGWHPISDAPEAYAVGGITVGQHVVVAFNGGQLPSALTFAEFHEATGTWERLPNPPAGLQAPFSTSPTLVHGGHVLFAVGFAQSSYDDTFGGQMMVMAFSPGTNSWHLIADPPIDGLIQTQPVWTGRELLVWGGNTEGRVAPIQGAAYNPRTKRWRKIPHGPLHQRINETVVWSGKEMIVWGGERVENDPLGAAYNPKTRRWRVLPKAPISSRAGSAAAWSGSEMLVWSGYSVFQDGPCCDDGAAYNPKTNSWRRLPDAPILGRELMSSVWTGRAFFVWGGIEFSAGRQTVNDGAMYDPVTNTWTTVASSPLESRWGAVAVWTGDSVLVIDGSGPSAPGVSGEPSRRDGAIFTPPTQRGG